MNGVEDRVTRFAEPDGRHRPPLAIELEYAVRRGIVVGFADAGVHRARAIDGHAKDPPFSLRAQPLPFEGPGTIEYLNP
ncbi:MAG: hypothetical protein ACREUU_12290 [Gammaproteobacteria bacterium]